MADEAGEELLLDVRVAEASWLYKFYLNQERKILGTLSVAVFLIAWELVGGVFQFVNPMFMSAPSFIWKAAVQLFGSGEIWNDLYVSGVEFAWGYVLSVVVAIPFGIAVGWYKKMAYLFDLALRLGRDLERPLCERRRVRVGLCPLGRCRDPVRHRGRLV